MVILLDSSGNNPVNAERIKRKYYFPFPLIDEEGKDIIEEQAFRNSNQESSGLENQTEKVRKRDVKDHKNE